MHMDTIIRAPRQELVILDSEPEPLEIDLARTAVVVIDMTNAFVKKGAFFDLRGQDLSRCEKTIEPIRRVTDAARAKGCKIIHIAHRYSLGTDVSAGPTSLDWYKSNPLRMYRQDPGLKDKLLFRGTWGAEFIDELKPQPGDIVIEKPRYSSFAGTTLDMTLRSYDVKYTVVIGIATNSCVEATIRDAYNLEYWPILVPDACANHGPEFTQETTIWNVKRTLGWVIDSGKFVGALK